MSLIVMLSQTADATLQSLVHAGPHLDAVPHLFGAGLQTPDAGIFSEAAGHGTKGLVHLAQNDQPATVENYANAVKALKPKADAQLGWLTIIGTHFIGAFQKGGEVFVGFVTGIIPTLVVLMTAFYSITGMIGEERVHGAAQAAGKYALTRYTVLPVLAVFFLTNPMAYTFGTFLEEKHKPAFYDSAVSFVHPILGLFPHANAGEYFVWGGVLVALLELEKKGAIAPNYHITLAIWYFIVGLIIILLKGILTERITLFMARRQGVEF